MSFFVTALLLTLAGGGTVAQTTAADKYIISARAGGINYIQGSVAVARTTVLGGTLIRGDRLEIGDVVSTSVAAKAEVLLNPGSFLRLGPNSEFKFLSTALEDLEIELKKGTATFEVFATNDFQVKVSTPNGQVAMVESGVYRIEIERDGTATIAVTEGMAVFGEPNTTEVKAGRMATIGQPSTIAKFDRKDRDEMAEWSRSRGKELAKMTASLKQKDIRGSLMSSFHNNRWNLYGSFGVWIYHPIYGYRIFLPFGNRWHSPYGFGFGYGMDWRDFWWYYRQPTNVAGNGGNGGGGVTAPPAKVRRHPPPFTEVEKRSGRQPRVDDSPGIWSTRTSGRGGVDAGVSPLTQAPPIQRVDTAGDTGRVPVQKTRPVD